MREQLHSYEKKIMSQNGEDGIIEELFSRIGTTNQFFVEFGVQDGLECNSAYLALFKNWSGLMIEGNLNHYKNLYSNFANRATVKIVHQFITKENIVSIFKRMHVPIEFDLLSIDIDGNDYWVWRALSEYNPRIVVIEYNASFPPPQKMVIKYNPNFMWDGTSYYGASLTSLSELGKELGYSLIGTDSRGVNAFFIRNDLVNASRFKELTPEQAYHPPAYGPYNGGHPWRDGPYLEI
ncbi:hypothetical protein ACKE5C_18645 [Aneurinibacillus thermoaerophilus]|uniref:hypothetical protein n=1 Tax=Aneurinibacillus thermoaerophilus TaxID=143495 RepID=UPI000A96DEB4|nr:hypothetical protein [Aneurinibacillus thermoaerophilus]MED0678622.1 hypothetical protein [Aneurinibacillus thermoaerophilus]MED0765343.1 hypothetical protein [Aneurinibacillus thermoaerophilus]